MIFQSRGQIDCQCLTTGFVSETNEHNRQHFVRSVDTREEGEQKFNCGATVVARA